MAVRDSFDPTWKMPNPDDTVAGAYEAPTKAGADSTKPSVIEYKGDGTAQLRSAANTKHNASIPQGGGAKERQPAGVDKFGGLSASPPSDRALKHGDFDSDSDGSGA